MSWRILVHNPDGTLRRTLTSDDPVDSLWWTVRGDGDNVEAGVRGTRLDIRPRDILRIDAASAPGGALAPRFWGWVTETGDPRGRGLLEHRLVGGASRLREIPCDRKWVGTVRAATEVAEMARDAVVLELGVVPRLSVPASFPATGFQLATYLAARAPIAQVLEDLAAGVPGFTVETGSTYVYDGVTYTAGQRVPPVMWGARAVSESAELFFRRAVTTLALDEQADELIVEFEPYSVEAVADRVRLLLVEATQFDRLTLTQAAVIGPRELPPVPVTHFHAAPGATLHATRIERVPPLDGMRSAAWSAAATGSNIANVANAFDSDPLTYASNNNAAEADFSLSRPATPQVRGVEVHYSSFVELQIRLRATNTFNDGSIAETTLASTNGEQVLLTLLTPFAWDVAEVGAGNATVTVTGRGIANDCRIYGLRLLEPNPPLLDRIAQGFLLLPLEAAATIIVPNRIVTPAARATITLSDTTTLSGDIGSLEHSITRDRGLETLIRLNHTLPAEAATVRALIDGRIRAGRDQGRGTP